MLERHFVELVYGENVLVSIYGDGTRQIANFIVTAVLFTELRLVKTLVCNLRLNNSLSHMFYVLIMYLSTHVNY